METPLRMPKGVPYTFGPYPRPDSLDIRRAKVGLPPIEEYFAVFQEAGMELIWDRSLTVEKARALR